MISEEERNYVAFVPRALLSTRAIWRKSRQVFRTCLKRHSELKNRQTLFGEMRVQLAAKACGTRGFCTLNSSSSDGRSWMPEQQNHWKNLIKDSAQVSPPTPPEWLEGARRLSSRTLTSWSSRKPKNNFLSLLFSAEEISCGNAAWEMYIVAPFN